MKYDFITIGGATEDITVYTKEGMIIDNKDDILQQKLLAFEYGAKLKVDRAYSTFGGGAANAAICLAKLKFRVAALVSLGRDNRGDRIIDNFRKHKVDTRLVQRYEGYDSGFSFLLVGQSNEHVVFSNRAANKKLTVGAKELRLLDEAGWLYMTSLSGDWKKVLVNIFKTKAKIAWNPGHIQLHTGVKSIGKYLKKTTVLVVNKDEALELVVSSPNFRETERRKLDSIKYLLKVLKEMGPQIAVITNGRFGADAYDGKEFYHQEILKEKKRVDTTGVGDAFGSTFTAGLIITRGDIQKAMKMSVKNTASVISQQGAQNGLLSKDAILKSV
ncbi:MAG: carbohydrate kinase family protein [Planctomycetes bacterium]|jgi:sugar/nucleoside kinase (ribokinase family)|nr:carbohydrate kinase family protein [Planctomycetota bacterium]